MRRSNSLLNNISKSQGAPAGMAHPAQMNEPYPGHAAPGQYQPVDTAMAQMYHSHSAQVANLAAQPPMHPHAVQPPYAMDPYANPAMMHGHATPAASAAMLHQGAGYPVATNPAHQMSGQPSGQDMFEMQNAKAALELMTERLNAIVSAQEARLGEHSEIGELKSHLQKMSQAIADMQVGVASLHNAPAPQINTLEISQLIERLHKDLNAKIVKLPQTQLDPSAYAKVVETSHANVIGEMRNVHATLENTSKSQQALGEALTSQQGELVSRLEMLSNSLASLDKTEEKAEIFAIRQQIAGLEKLIVERSNTTPVSDGDQAAVHERLEEITRAVLALSGTDNGTDALERLEARIIDISKRMNAQEGSAQGNASFDPAALDPYLDETRSAFQAIDSKIASLSANVQNAEPQNDLLAEIRALSDKLSNLAALSSVSAETNHGDGAQLLQRLDELVERVESLRTDEAGETEATGFSNFHEQLTGISEQLSKLSNASGNDTSGEVLNRLDTIVDRIDAISVSSNEGQSTQLVNSLEEQIAAIASSLSHASPNSIIEPLKTRLDGIEQQISASRDIGIEMATGAAEEAVKRVVAELPQSGSSVDQGILQELLSDVRKLGENTNLQSEQPDFSLEPLGQTLDQIAQRLVSLEGSLEQLRNNGAAGIHEPPVDAGMAMQAQPFVEATPPTAPLQQADKVREKIQPTPVQADIAEQSPAEEPLAAGRGVEQKRSAGEALVRAARQAEQERKLAKQGEEEEFAKASSVPDDKEIGIEPNVSADQPVVDTAPVLPEVSPPEMSYELPEATHNIIPPRSGENGKDDVPLEPGVGGPDLAALVKQANDRRKALSERGEDTGGTDFLAAARRAAQAAAKEAHEIEQEEAETGKESGGLMSSISGILSNRKNKAIIMAAAVALLIAAAVPLVTSFTSSPAPVEIASNENITEAEPIASAALVPEAVDTTPEPEVADTTPEPEVVVVPVDEQEVLEEPEIVAVDPEIAEPAIDTPIDAPVIASSLSEPEENSGGVTGFPFDRSEIEFAPEDLQAAALDNDPLAIFELGRRFTDGFGTEKDMAKAAAYYEHSAGMGFVPAQYIIGNFHEKGIGVTADRTIAQAWYEQAAAAGHVVAMHNLGVLHASPDPETGNTDLPKAFKWFSLAADYGVRDSQVNLGIFLAKGMAGEVDLVESYKWLGLAAKSGDKDATEKRDFIAEAIRPDQLEEAKKLVENWQALTPEASVNDVVIPDSWKANQPVIALLTDRQSIAQVQDLLTKVGFDAGPADGVIGKKTKSAIVAFRSRSGLPVTDQVDTELMEALKAVAI